MTYSFNKKKVPDISEIQALAIKYSKKQLQKLVQLNLVEPGDAVMAGMMIDRVRAQNMKPPQQTVADEALGVNVEPEVMPQQAMPQLAGITALPSGLPPEMAGGGIVAFADGGDIDDYADGGVVGYAKGNLVNAADTIRRSGMTPEQITEMFASAGPGVPAAAPQEVPPQAAPSDMQGITLPGGLKFKEYPVRPRTDITEQLGKLTEAEKAVGIDDEAMFEKFGAEEKERRKGLDTLKNQALGNALIMGGFGLLGARKGEEYEVLSTVGRQGVMQYGAAMKEIREIERDISKTERALTLAKNQLKRDKSSKALERVDAAEKAHEESKAKGIEQYNDAVKTLANLNEKYISGDRQSATQLAVAQINRSTQLATAGMPGAEQKLLMALQQNPELMDTFQKMKSVGNKEEARAKAALALEKEWNDIMSDITGESLRKVKEMYPNVKTGDDYIREKMKVFEQYYKGGRPASGAEQIVVQTPQGAVQFKTQAEADAFKQKFGLK